MAPRIDIGIDGGGTGCRVAIAVPGRDCLELHGAAANIVTDPAGAEAAVREVLRQGLARAGLGEQVPGTARVVAGLAGGRLPGAAEAFAARLPFPARVVDDSVIALEGALAGRDGTLASLGTGSFFISKTGGTVRHVGGWGLALGDEGSAAWLGRRALSLALRVADGRMPPDTLADALMADAPPHPSIFARDARPGDYARIARRVLEHRDNPLARRLMAEVLTALAEGIADAGHAAGLPLVVTGGLGDLVHDLLPEPLRADLVPAAGRPLDGALALARGLP